MSKKKKKVKKQYGRIKHNVHLQKQQNEVNEYIYCS